MTGATLFFMTLNSRPSSHRCAQNREIEGGGGTRHPDLWTAYLKTALVVFYSHSQFRKTGFLPFNNKGKK